MEISRGKRVYRAVRNKALTYYYFDLHTQHYLRLLVTILIAFITTAVMIYPEPFRLVTFPFSYLGRKSTPSGMSNVYSRMVFNLGLFFCAYTMWIMARYFHKRHPVPDSPVYESLSYLSAAGFVLMMVPCDEALLRFLHSFGSGFVVGSHLIMSVIRMLGVRHHLKKWTIPVILAVLLFFVLFYAVTWFLDKPHHPLYQKPAFLSIILVELYGSWKSRFHGESRVFRQLPSQQLH